MKTQNELTCAKETLTKSCSDLTTTRDELSLTQNELKETKVSLKTMENQLKITRNELTTTNIELKDINTNLTTTRHDLQHFCFIQLKRLFQEDQPEASHSYQTKLQCALNSIDIGEIHQTDKKECFFKLHIPQSYNKLVIKFCDDIESRKSHYTVFNNDCIALDDGEWLCVLWVSIKIYNEENSQCFLVDATKGGRNRLLEFDNYNEINDRWSFYRNDKHEVLFYFKKK